MDDIQPEKVDATAADKASIAAQLMRGAWRLVILVVGGTVVAVGVAMIVLPGPAFVVIPAGLAILATEFVWARRLLVRVRDYVKTTLDDVRKKT